VSVTLAGTPLEVTWAGLAPGFAGLYQVNALLPADFGSGIVYATLPLVVSAGGRGSNSGLVVFGR
jgi:adhesin/invasin